LVAGLLYLQHAFRLSDEAVVARWVENPYYQHLTGEVFFQHKLPIDPSSLTRWRGRIGEEGGEWLLTRTGRARQNSGVIDENSAKRGAVDTTVMEKNIAYHQQPAIRRMDRNLRHRTPDRCPPRQADAPRQHHRDERRQLPPWPKPRPKGRRHLLITAPRRSPAGQAPWHAPAIRGGRAPWRSTHHHWPGSAPPRGRFLLRRWQLERQNCEYACRRHVRVGSCRLPQTDLL